MVATNIAQTTLREHLSTSCKQYGPTEWHTGVHIPLLKGQACHGAQNGLTGMDEVNCAVGRKGGNDGCNTSTLPAATRAFTSLVCVGGDFGERGQPLVVLRHVASKGGGTGRIPMVRG